MALPAAGPIGDERAKGEMVARLVGTMSQIQFGSCMPGELLDKAQLGLRRLPGAFQLWDEVSRALRGEASETPAIETLRR